MRPLLPTAQVAETLGIRATTVRDLITSGELRAYRVGRVIKVRPDDIEAFLDAIQVQPTP